uniref:hypothetical protein n=1 Tax=Klebsiella pneumoniae TaxID=573 RepID=UPI001E567AE5|nr:hypothetical protein [Klebsiella pneumoniae]
MKIQEKKYLALPHLLQGKEKGIVNLKNLAGGGIVCGLNADLTGICCPDFSVSLPDKTREGF